MPFWHKSVARQQKFVKDFIHFKLIKIVEFFFFIKVDFCLPQKAQFDKSINLFCLVFLFLEFSLAVYLLQKKYRFLTQ